MIRGLYTACAGMLAQQARQDVVANNLANINTPGFKKDVVVYRAFPTMLVKRIGELRDTGQGEKPAPPVTTGKLGTGSAVAEIVTDLSTGSLQKTDNPLDIALGSDGYFVVQTPNGERYTRDGCFKLDSNGILTTSQGYPVLGKTGIIEVGEKQVTVDKRGNVNAGDELLDTLRVVRFGNPRSLVKIGDNLFEAGGQTPAEVTEPQVLQGYLELSNVNSVKEMVELITVVRAYEANQKVIQAEDQTLDAAVNRVGTL